MDTCVQMQMIYSLVVSVQWLLLFSLATRPAFERRATRGQYLTCNPWAAFTEAGSRSLDCHCALWPVLPQPPVSVCACVCRKILDMTPEARLHFRQSGIWTLERRIIWSIHTCRIKWVRLFCLGTSCPHPGLTQQLSTTEGNYAFSFQNRLWEKKNVSWTQMIFALEKFNYS